MGGIGIQDAGQGADSSAAQTQDATQGAPAGAVNTDQAQNGAQAQEKLTPFHQHPDWQRMVRERNESRTAQDQMRQELQALRQSHQAAQRAGQASQVSPEEQQAIDALSTLLKKSPWGKTLLGLVDAAPHLIKGYQGVQQLTQTQQTGVINSSRREIGTLAQSAGLPHAAGDVDLYEDIVTGIIGRDPEALQRFQQGDTSVVGDAFKKFTDGFAATLRRGPTAALVDTKLKTKQLPPRPAGGAAGPAAPEKLKPGDDPRQFAANMGKRARAMLSELLPG